MLNAVPTIDELAANPDKVASLDATTALALLVKVMSVQALLLAKAVAPTGSGHSEVGAEDRLLTVAEAATMLNVPRQFAYELARRGEIPTVRVGQKYIRVPLRGLKKVLDGNLSNLDNNPRKARRHANDRGRTADHSQKARPDPDGNG